MKFRRLFALCLILLSVAGCGVQRRVFCADDRDMQIGIGRSVYGLPKAEIINPENASGLIVVNDGSRYCQKMGSDFIKARQVYVHVPRERSSGKTMLLGLLAPESFIDRIKPTWPAIASEQIAGFEFGEMTRDRNVAWPTLSVSIRLKSGEVRPLKFWCAWTDTPLNDHKGGWIGLCRPILPLSDGNFLEISTGGTPDTEPSVIGQDIVQGLREAERLIRAARPLPDPN